MGVQVGFCQCFGQLDQQSIGVVEPENKTSGDPVLNPAGIFLMPASTFRQYEDRKGTKSTGYS